MPLDLTNCGHCGSLTTHPVRVRVRLLEKDEERSRLMGYGVMRYEERVVKLCVGCAGRELEQWAEGIGDREVRNFLRVNTRSG